MILKMSQFSTDLTKEADRILVDPKSKIVCYTGNNWWGFWGGYESLATAIGFAQWLCRGKPIVFDHIVIEPIR